MIIVTGGAGFIGLNIAQELSKTNKVVICDKLNDPAKKKNISSIKGIKIIKIEEIFSFVSAILFKRSSLLADAATCHPSLANFSASALPMPLLAPVIQILFMKI